MLNHLFRSDDRVFLSRWLRAPLSTGAVTPSGRALARLMAAQIDPEADGHVIELGAGTGAITRALLDAGVDCRRLVLIEKDPVLHGLLSRRYPA
ncbi:MAG TPA: rRNA adenine N-6-methyltransferase family protein, partial [Alphaproteobacteria bacterium]|nr:rRNA adenine N-6-methyltransferase family protein [Alphaproteobacteria bacterium]